MKQFTRIIYNLMHVVLFLVFAVFSLETLFHSDRYHITFTCKPGILAAALLVFAFLFCGWHCYFVKHENPKLLAALVACWMIVDLLIMLKTAANVGWDPYELTQSRIQWIWDSYFGQSVQASSVEQVSS